MVSLKGRFFVLGKSDLLLADSDVPRLVFCARKGARLSHCLALKFAFISAFLPLKNRRK
jgi:hypothetical protein